MHQPEQGAAKQSPASEPPKTTQPLICLIPDSVIKVNQAQSNTGAPGNSLSALGTEQPGQAEAEASIRCWWEMMEVLGGM